MAKIGLVVGLLAAGAAVWLGLEVRCLRSAVETQRQEIAELRGSATAPVREPAAPEAQPTALVRPEGAAAGGGVVEAGAGPTLEPAPGRPPTLEDKVAALERRIEEQTKAVTALRRSGAEQTLGPPGHWIHDAESAAKELKLDDREKAEVERVLGAMRRDLEDLRTRPNDEGMTWKEASKVTFEGSSDGAFIALAGNSEKLSAFKRSKIPGSSETYAEADRRIRTRAKEATRRLLTPEQQKSFDEAHTEGLFGGGPFESFAISIGGAVEETGNK